MTAHTRLRFRQYNSSSIHFPQIKHFENANQKQYIYLGLFNADLLLEAEEMAGVKDAGIKMAILKRSYNGFARFFLMFDMLHPKHVPFLSTYLIRINFRADKFSRIFAQNLNLREIARKLVLNFFTFAHKKKQR